jgi:hypothetical protein
VCESKAEPEIVMVTMPSLDLGSIYVPVLIVSILDINKAGNLSYLA